MQSFDILYVALLDTLRRTGRCINLCPNVEYEPRNTVIVYSCQPDLKPFPITSDYQNQDEQDEGQNESKSMHDSECVLPNYVDENGHVNYIAWKCPKCSTINSVAWFKCILENCRFPRNGCGAPIDGQLVQSKPFNPTQKLIDQEKALYELDQIELQKQKMEREKINRQKAHKKRQFGIV